MEKVCPKCGSKPKTIKVADMEFVKCSGKDAKGNECSIYW